MPEFIIFGFRLLLAVVCGGVIGREREINNRPAGFRTYILVCTGATLVMLTNEVLFETYRGIVNTDPARLGAQVISGIGFLGAGTIIREGATVKGLTTAASLWAISCVGIAIGAGFYTGGLLATALIYATLKVLKYWEDKFPEKTIKTVFRIVTSDRKGIITDITAAMAEIGVHCRNVDMVDRVDARNELVLKYQVRYSQHVPKSRIIERVHSLPEVRRMTETAEMED